MIDETRRRRPTVGALTMLRIPCPYCGLARARTNSAIAATRRVVAAAGNAGAGREDAFAAYVYVRNNPAGPA